METILSSAWILWFLVAIALFIFELMTAGFLLACFGVGALGGAIAAGVGLETAWQLAAFSIVSIGAIVFLRPSLVRLFNRSKGDNTPLGIKGLIGRKTYVKRLLEGGYAEVAIDGDVWRIRHEDDKALSEGEHVIITGNEGIILCVKQAHNDL